jgi:hypothetical protein
VATNRIASVSTLRTIIGSSVTGPFYEIFLGKISSKVIGREKSPKVAQHPHGKPLSPLHEYKGPYLLAFLTHYWFFPLKTIALLLKSPFPDP